MLKIENLSKTYRNGVQAISKMNLEIGAGILGLLGPNGAGKSSLMRIMATITRPSTGKIHWNGQNIISSPNALCPYLGYLPQDFGVYPHLNALEFLSYLAAAKGLHGDMAKSRIRALLERVNLVGVSKRQLGTLSGGMKQRVGIAQALLNDPKLLIVDEPTAGLDPQERVGFRHLLTELSADRIVILSSHIVSDIEATANDIVIINKGTLICHETPEKLLIDMEGKVWEVVISSSELSRLKEQFIVSSTVRCSQGIKVRLISSHKPTAQAIALPPNLEEAYLHALSDNRTGRKTA